MLVFVFVHFIGLSLVVATASYFLVGRLLGPGVPGLPGRRRQGLFVQPGDGEQLEFGYCFDVRLSTRNRCTMDKADIRHARSRYAHSSPCGFSST